MRSLLPALVALLAGGSALATEVNEALWHTYRNTRYGYEVRHPPGTEVIEVGPPQQRDGRSIVVRRRDYAAVAPNVHIDFVGDGSGSAPAPEGPLRDLEVGVAEVAVGGERGRRVEYRWKANGEISMVELRLPRFRLRYAAQAGVHDPYWTPWWRIVTSFRVGAADPASGR